jgi:hypothetical protein
LPEVVEKLGRKLADFVQEEDAMMGIGDFSRDRNPASSSNQSGGRG